LQEEQQQHKQEYIACYNTTSAVDH